MISSHNVIASFEWFSISNSIYISIWCTHSPKPWHTGRGTVILISHTIHRYVYSYTYAAQHSAHDDTAYMYVYVVRERTMTVILCFNLILFDVACRILVIFIVKIEFRSTWITIIRSLSTLSAHIQLLVTLYGCVHLRVDYDLLNASTILCAMRFTGW